MSFQLQPDFSLPQGLLNGQHQNNVIGPMMNTVPDSSGVHLYIFSPKNITPQFRRAHLYQFGPNFVNQVGESIEASIRHGNVKKNSFMYDSQEAPSAITPNSFGTPVNLNTFSDLWSFLLILDIVRGSQMPTMGIGVGMHVPFNTRCIYVGYCSDEPVNTTNMGNGVTINPQAALIITHHTVVNQVQEVDAFRSVTRSNTVCDVDLVPNHIIPQISPPVQDQHGNVDSNRYLMTPGNLHRSTSFNEFDQTAVYTGSEAMIKPTVNNTAVVANLNSPRHHMSDVVGGLAHAFTHTAGLYSGSGTIDDQDMGILHGADVFHESVDTYYNSHSTINRALSPINPDVPVTLGTLNSMFPNMRLTDCRIPAMNQWDSISQEAPNIVNIYGSMLSTTVPALLAGMGLSQIAFRYISRDVTNSFGVGAGDGSAQLLDIATFIQLSPEAMRLKFENFMHYMKFTVFPTLLAGGGDFDVTMYCSVAGTSLINLHFLDFPSYHYNNAFYESTTSLGGLISPLIGTTNELQHNATQLSNLIRAVRPAPSAF